MSDTTQSARLASVAGDAQRWSLVLVGSGDLRTHALPASGEIVIGRDATCDLAIDHAGISRRHVRVRFGPTCTVEDLGSRNGTIVHGTPLGRGEERQLASGESFVIGPFTAVLVPEGTARVDAAPSSLVVEDPAAVTQPALLLAVARSPLTVLVRGETGTGKEVLASTLHRLSERSGPLLRLNCGAFTPELIESELFGHERGAFTGAVAAKPGLFESAGGGTVLLDEIGELPAALQTRLLRAIEAREVVRVGGVRPVPIEVRFLAATHRDLQAEIAAGRFRLDLYYRLAVVTLTIPSLRERPGRIAGLAQELAAAAVRDRGRPAPRFTTDALARLQAHDWPGNVRELRNVVERAVLLSLGAREIGGEHVVLDVPSSAAARASIPTPPPTPPAEAAEADALAAERARIIEALDACGGNQSHAAKRLGMARSTFVTKMQIHRIRRSKYRG